MDVINYKISEKCGSFLGGHVSMGRSFRGQLRRDYISDRIMETISPQLHKIGTDAKKDERICPGNINTNITIGRWTQPLDQFDTTNKAEWKQVEKRFKRIKLV
jgi:hypothetical protein